MDSIASLVVISGGDGDKRAFANRVVQRILLNEGGLWSPEADIDHLCSVVSRIADAINDSVRGTVTFAKALRDKVRDAVY